MQAGLAAVWPYFDELFRPDPVLDGLPPALADPAALRDEVEAVVADVLRAATLDRPAGSPGPAGEGTGRDGHHTPYLGDILAELQSVARAHPHGSW
jgi:ring-1,2-phenylacetyl-CoA epoxidase subunit PaaC